MPSKKESWVKSNIFSLISLATMIAGAISYGSVMHFRLKEALKDIDALKKEVREISSLGDIKNMRKLIEDKVFIIKTGVYKEIEKMEVLFQEKFRNSEKREQEFRQDLKELRRAINRIGRK